MSLEGEQSPREARKSRAHLESCWRCRSRRQQLESAIDGFVRTQQEQLDAQLPPSAGPRAMLKAQLSQLAAQPVSTPPFRFPKLYALAAATVIVIFVAARSTTPHPPAKVVDIPDSRLTPGAAILASRPAVCSQENTKNRTVPVALQRKVFEEYGISGAEPRNYEVDYLITPALGGADDIHNLWPHSYKSTVWNAQVKDQLEDRLRQMVCDGHLELAEAQQEIASNWIAAYEKYFHTDKPLPH